MDSDQTTASASPTRLSLFEDRYGAGAHERLLALLQQPCISFAEIATRFGVTRERVRQWHQQLMPDAPAGRTRRRLCLQSRQRQELVKDPLFRSFVNHLRVAFPELRLTPIPMRDGYRKRAVGLDGRLIALKRARVRRGSTGNESGSAASESVYTLPRAPRHAAFIYVELSAGDFLFVPRAALHASTALFVDNGAAPHARYKNTFTALREDQDQGGELPPLVEGLRHD